jgi:hypothetical protein
MLTNQQHTIEETLDLLKGVEVMEASEGFKKSHSQSTQNHNAARPGSNPAMNDRRGQTQKQVRQIQYSGPRNRSNWNSRCNKYISERERESSNIGSTYLNPNAPSFQGHQEQVQPRNSNNSRSEN